MNCSGHGAAAGVAQSRSSTAALSSSSLDQSFVLVDYSEEFANCWCCWKQFADGPHHRQKPVCFHWRTKLNEKNLQRQDERREQQYSVRSSWTNPGYQRCSTVDRAYDVNEDLGGMAAGKVEKRHNGGLPEELQIGTGNQGS